MLSGVILLCVMKVVNGGVFPNYPNLNEQCPLIIIFSINAVAMTTWGGASADAASFTIVSGNNCEIVDDCVQTKDFGNTNYVDNDETTINIDQGGILINNGFEIEHNSGCTYDSVTLKSQNYCGTAGPQNVAVSKDDRMVFKTDSETGYKGFNFCVIPFCTKTDGSSANSGKCFCGTTECNSNSGLYCLSSANKCGSSQMTGCSATDGSSANSEICFCGTTECNSNTGLYCLSSSSSCGTSNFCTTTDGSAANYDNCLCGTTECNSNSGLFCLSSANKCGSSELTACSVTDGSSANSGNCFCGTTGCDSNTGLYCRSSLYCRKSGGIPMPNQLVEHGVHSGIMFYKTNTIMQQAAKDWVAGGAKRQAVVDKYGNIEDWDLSQITNLAEMFRGDSFGPFNADISKWDVSRVSTMRGLFEQQKDFKQDISGWDTSNVVNMYALFKDTKFNGDISKWVVLKVTQMFEMLIRNEGFAQGLWCSPSWSESPVSAAGLPEGNAAFCCPTGHYLGGNGVTTFSISYLAKKTDCTKCPIGAYMDSKNIERSCSQCPTGWYQHQTGKAFCFPCIPGYYQNLQGKKECKECDEHTYNGDTGRTTTCIDCPTGWTSSDKGGVKCQICENGMFNNKQGDICENCVAGQYRNGIKEGTFDEITDPTKCIDCPKGWTAATGATKCQSCEMGMYGDVQGEQSCKFCPKGFYRNSIKESYTDRSKCIDCPKGWSSVEGSAKCQQCNGGTFNDIDGGEACKTCASGSVSKSGATICTVCDLGKKTNDDSTSCDNCDLGKYGINLNECSNCPQGTYQDGKGETACKECSMNTYSSEEGKSSNADCTSCKLDRSTSGIKGAADSSFCLCKRKAYYQANNMDDGTSTCEICPDGGDCSAKDGLTLTEIIAKPGRWRPDATSLIFSPCSVAFSGTKDQRNKMAEGRCCPFDSSTNISKCVTLTNMTHSDQQCDDGYRGALCLVCAESHVKQGDFCVPCKERASIMYAFLALGIVCIPIFLGIFLILYCSVKEEKVEKGSKVVGKIKIIVAYLQVLSALPGVMESVAWPEIFVSFTVPLMAINIDVMSIFAQSACSMAILFPKQFIVHMSMPLFILLTVLFAYFCSNICGKKTKEAKQQRSAQTFKIILVLANLLYPGLCTRIFQMFYCKYIPGVDDGAVLVADFSLRCGLGEHRTFAGLGVLFLFIYVIGIPFAIFCILKKNRKHLYDTKSKKHNEVLYKLGGLYSQYEEKYWWFEIVIILHKMVMTGAMCLIGAGSSAQPMIGTLVQLFFLLLVIKTAPYDEDSDDWASFVTSLTLTLTLFAAFAISNTNPENPNFDSFLVGIMMIAISILCIIFEIGLAAYDLEFPCCKHNNEFAKMRDARKQMLEESSNKTKVVPTETTEKQIISEELRDIRLKYGASSEEYMKAAKGITK